MRAALDTPLEIGPYHLREGFHGKAVYFGIDLRTGQPVALKEAEVPLDWNEDGRHPAEVGREYMEYEHSLQSRLKHPHISSSTLCEHKGELYLVTPDFGRQTLAHRRVDKCPKEERLQVLEDIANALSYSHDHRIVHIDIKEENTMVNNKRGVLIDFGAARELGKPHPVTQTSILCTAICAAPEYIFDHKYSTRSDSFSYALMAFRTLTESEPFRTYQTKEGARLSYQDHLYHGFELEDLGKLGELVIKALSLRPEERPEMKEIVQAFTKQRSKPRPQPNGDSLALFPASS